MYQRAAAASAPAVRAEDHLPLVRLVANRYRVWGEQVGLTVDDLLQEGLLAIHQAAARCDPERGHPAKFMRVIAGQRMRGVLKRQKRLVQPPEAEEAQADVLAQLAARPEAGPGIQHDVGILPESARDLVEAHYGLRDGRPRTLEDRAHRS